MTDVHSIIKRIRAYAKQPGVSVSAIARSAGLRDESTVRKALRDGGNPTLRTIAAIERVIPEDFQPGVGIGNLSELRDGK